MRKAALITGSAQRVGRVVALHLAREGYDIALHYGFSEQEAHEVRAEILSLGRECVLLQADLADSAQAEALVPRAVAALPHVSALINNASIFERAPFPDAPLDSFTRHMEVNLRAPVILTQQFANVVQRGAVVNMLDAKITEDKHSYFYYLLSKKSLADFTRMSAVALAPDVRVNGLALPKVLEDKNLIAPVVFEEKTTWCVAPLADGSCASQIPLIATPADVARAVQALIEGEANGEVRFLPI